MEWQDMWIVVDVGCIECGEDTNIVGVFSNEARADAIADQLNDVLDFTGGQHSYVVFPMPKPDTIGEYYVEHISLNPPSPVQKETQP